MLHPTSPVWITPSLQLLFINWIRIFPVSIPSWIHQTVPLQFTAHTVKLSSFFTFAQQIRLFLKISFQIHLCSSIDDRSFLRLRTPNFDHDMSYLHITFSRLLATSLAAAINSIVIEASGLVFQVMALLAPHVFLHLRVNLQLWNFRSLQKRSPAWNIPEPRLNMRIVTPSRCFCFNSSTTIPAWFTPLSSR